MDSKKRRAAEKDGAREFTSEDVRNLIEPFAREQLLDILQRVALRYGEVLDELVELADKDPNHRKLFVRGLGRDTTSETLSRVFSEHGEIVEAFIITDKNTGKSKGYGFVTYKHMEDARRALKEPSKKVDGRFAVCQLASAGAAACQGSNLDQAARKVYVGNVPVDLSADKLLSLFAKYGEIEEGPLAFDNQTGNSMGFALFVYRSVESAKRALEEPIKTIDGHKLICKLAVDSQKKREWQKQKVGVGALPGQVDRAEGGVGVPSNVPDVAVNAETLAGALAVNPAMNLVNINPGLAHGVNPVIAAQSLQIALDANQSLASLNSYLNPSVAHQLASNPSLGSQNSWLPNSAQGLHFGLNANQSLTNLDSSLNSSVVGQLAINPSLGHSLDQSLAPAAQSGLHCGLPANQSLTGIKPSLNPSVIGQLALNPSLALQLGLNPSLIEALNASVPTSAHGLDSSLNVNESISSLNSSAVRQLALTPSLNHSLYSSLNSSLPSSLNTSLVQGGGSKGFTPAPGQAPSSIDINRLGLLGSYSSQVSSLGSSDGVTGTSLYGMQMGSILSQTGVTGGRQALGSLMQSLPSYYTN